MRKPRPRAVTEFDQGHTASKWQSQDINSCSLAPESRLLGITLHGLLQLPKPLVPNSITAPT